MPVGLGPTLMVELIGNLEDGAGSQPVVESDRVAGLVRARCGPGLAQHVIAKDWFQVFDEGVLDARGTIGKLDIPAVAVVRESEGAANRAGRIVSEFIHVGPDPLRLQVEDALEPGRLADVAQVCRLEKRVDAAAVAGRGHVSKLKAITELEFGN